MMEWARKAKGTGFPVPLKVGPRLGRGRRRVVPQCETSALGFQSESGRCSADPR